MRLEMVIWMQNESLNGREILVNFKFKLIKTKSQLEFVPRDTEEFKSNQNLNSNLYREIPRNLSFSILTSWLKIPHHPRFRFTFRWPFLVSHRSQDQIVWGKKSSFSELFLRNLKSRKSQISWHSFYCVHSLILWSGFINPPNIWTVLFERNVQGKDPEVEV